MPPRKKTEPDFPPHTCGACDFCMPMDDEDVQEQQGVCFAVPPSVLADLGNVRPMVQWDSKACIYFKPRIHA